MLIILLGNVITHLYFGLNNVIRSSGNPKLAMGLTIFTVVSNTIMDPIFIFVLDMGIKGAALATVLCQCMALVIALRYVCDQKSFLHLPAKISQYKLDLRIAKDALAIGMGPFLMNSAACIVTMFINLQLRKYGGDLSIGAYGIVNRISFLFVMVNMGFNQGMQPIAGYNFGARKYSRVKEVFWLTVKCATVVSVAGFALSEFAPGIAVSLFTSDAELKELAEKGLKLTNIAFPIVGFQMVATNFFQSMGMVRKSVLLSLSRQLLFLVPLVYFLPLFFGHKGVWLSFPVSDVVAFLFSVIMLMFILAKFSRLNDGDDPSSLGSKI